MKIDEFKDNIDGAYTGLIKKRSGRFRIWGILLRMVLKFTDNMRKDYVGPYAAQAAFYTMLSSVPFIMLVILCLKYFISFDMDAVINTIETTFPAQVSSFLSQIITEVFHRSQSTAVLSAVAVAALWASSKGTMAIYCGLNQINGYVKPYNWIAARIVSFFYNIVFMLVIITSAMILVFGDTLLGLVENIFPTAHYVHQLMFNTKIIDTVFIILLVPGFMALYTVLPQHKKSFFKQLPGAVATVLGWVVFSAMYKIYIEQYSKYSLIYGSLTAIVFLMLWIFFCLYMLLIGAEINKHMENGFFSRVWKNIRGNKIL